MHANDASAGWIAYEKDFDSFAAVVVDIAMPAGPLFSALEARSGFHAGLALSRRILRFQPGVRLIGLTGMPDDKISQWFKTQHFPLLLKQKVTFKQLLDNVLLAKPAGMRSLKQCFIVHGHDAVVVGELKDFVENELDSFTPVVLAESKSGGLTVIEKFEQYAETAFIAFVLLTPDDCVVDPSGKIVAHRARQNVIFELGYFLGRRGRSNGRVLILTKGDVEIPSDIAGMVRIDITGGVLECAAEILREIQD